MDEKDVLSLVNTSVRSSRDRTIIQQAGTNRLKRHKMHKPLYSVNASKKANSKTSVGQIAKGIKQMSYTCPQCKYTCGRKNTMVHHMKSHNDRHQRFSMGESTTQPAEENTGNLLWKRARKKRSKCQAHLCWICGFRTSFRSNLEIHLRRHTGEKPYLCSLCGFRTARLITLTEHLRTHTKEKPYVCTHCGRSFTMQSSLITHTKLHTREKQHVCPHCEYKCIQKSAMMGHLFTHSIDGQHKCPFCDYTSDHKRSLSGHMGIHNVVKPHTDSVINGDDDTTSEFTRTSERHTEVKHCTDSERHTEVKHFTDSVKRTNRNSASDQGPSSALGHNDYREVNTDLCTMLDHTRNTESPDDMKPDKDAIIVDHDTVSELKDGPDIHTDKHIAIELLSYSQSATGSGRRKTTSKVHTVDKLYKCLLCSYSTARGGDFQRHKKTHVEEKPYKCSMCEYSCIRRASLAVHMARGRHTTAIVKAKVKPFQCSICDYSSNYKSDLNRHTRWHTGEKPHKCSQCDYSAIRKSLLVSHLKKHDKGKIAYH